MNSQSENNTQQNSAMDMLRKKNTRTLSELEQIPYQPQVYAIPIEQRKRESKLLADAVEFQPKLYQMIERLATAEELSDHCINIQNIEAEYMEKTVREVVTENRKTAAQMQNLVEQAGKNQEQFILNCSETLSKSTETLDSTIEKLRRKILKIMIATAVSTVVLSLLVCAVFWKLAVYSTALPRTRRNAESALRRRKTHPTSVPLSGLRSVFSPQQPTARKI